MIDRDVFGHFTDGTPVERITLRRGQLEVSCLALGATIQALRVPDRVGRLGDIVLGHDTLDPYVTARNYFGATVGRVANRIEGAAFQLDGRRHALPANDGANTLHGGSDGFDRRLWSVIETSDEPDPSVTFGLVSPDGDQGFPGRVEVSITYALTDETTLSIAFAATTDATTPVALTNHAFFNFGGVEEPGSILGHLLRIAAERFLPVDAGLIPESEPRAVAGTPFDFREPHPIGSRIRTADPQLILGRGYDHNFCLSDRQAAEPRFAARVEDPRSGRAMELWTDQPGLQFYSGNFLDGSVAGKAGNLYRQSDAFCLEPQPWPNAVNRSSYPSIWLTKDRTYRHVSLYRFAVMQ